jgi:hypothetical protein
MILVDSDVDTLHDEKRHSGWRRGVEGWENSLVGSSYIVLYDDVGT